MGPSIRARSIRAVLPSARVPARPRMVLMGAVGLADRLADDPGYEPPDALALALDLMGALALAERIESLPTNCAITRSDGRWRVWTGGGAGAGADLAEAIARATGEAYRAGS